MKTLKVWFPGFFTEAHKSDSAGALLVSALYNYGIECVRIIDNKCDLVFCGSFFYFGYVQEALKDFDIPVAHYNWDLYPFNIENIRDDVGYGDKWRRYVEELNERDCVIIVPSKCTTDRTTEFVGKPSVVIKSSVRTFTHPVKDGRYVLNCMRGYPDPNRIAVEQACKELRIPFINTGNNLEWDDYKKIVAECSFIVSAQYEASTGGLSALEAYALGKRVLLSNSPRHGGIDYFGDKARYFTWDSMDSLKYMIQKMWKESSKTDIAAQRHWVETEYSEDKMALELSKVFRKMVGQSERVFTTQKCVSTFAHVDHIENEHGYISWRTGSGANIEILHIRVNDNSKGLGKGKMLIKQMLEVLQQQSKAPYNSVYGFTKASNDVAIKFYESLDFTISKPIDDLYRDERAIVFSIPYTDLLGNT